MSTSTPTKLRSSARRQRRPSTPPTAAASYHNGEQTPLAASGGERKAGMEKRFTEEDEIQLLSSVLKIAKSSSSPVVKIDDLIFNRIGTSVSSKFTRTQVNQKFRRLKLKYRKLSRNNSSLKKPHDRQLYELGRYIWGKNRVPVAEENGEEELEEEREIVGVDLTKFPVLVDECEKSLGGNGVWEELLKGLEESKVREMNDRLVMVRHEEANVMAKKAKLVQELTRMILGAVSSPPRTGLN